MFYLRQRMQFVNRNISKSMNIVAEIFLYLSLLPDFQSVFFSILPDMLAVVGLKSPLVISIHCLFLDYEGRKSPFSLIIFQVTMRIGSIEITAA